MANLHEPLTGARRLAVALGPHVVADLTATIALSGCNARPPAAPPAAPPEVAVTTVHRSRVPVSTELPGRTSAFLVAQVRARVDGIVQKRLFTEGGDVRANQPLYQIDPAPYRAALESAEAALQKAQANLVSTTALADRYQRLIAGNAVSKQDLDNAVATQGQAAADVASAKAALETARINLGYTTVLSPITGRTGPSLVTQGAYVQASAATLLTTVQQIDPMYVDLAQSSVEGLHLRRDTASGRVSADSAQPARVTLTLEDSTPYRVPGTLQFSGITVDPATGSVTARAVFPNPKQLLLPGMFVRADVDEGFNDNALLVPQTGVTHNPQGEATVLVVGSDDKIASRTVQATRTIGDRWIVEGGLDDGACVVVSGIQKVKPGLQVHAVEAAASAAGAASASSASSASASAAAPAASR